MFKTILRLFSQPQKQKCKEMYHFILQYRNESGHLCEYRTYAPNYQAAKSELLRQYPNKTITNISIKSKNLQ